MPTTPDGPGLAHDVDRNPDPNPDTTAPPGTPPEVIARAALGMDGQRHPITDPTLGIPVSVDVRAATPPHRLVTIGDSLTHGFQSGAIFNTDLSYPALIARELGWFEEFRYPCYGKEPGDPGLSLGGQPLNVEYLLRALEPVCGDEVHLWDIPQVMAKIFGYLDKVQAYWEQGPGCDVPTHGQLHNLGVTGWNLRDALTSTYAACASLVSPTPRVDKIDEIVESSGQRMAMRVYPNDTEESRQQTVFDAARTLGEDHDDQVEAGIETLIVMLGANNALQSITDLRLTWTDDAYGTSQEFARGTQKLSDGDGKRRLRPAYTVWRPDHFRQELRQVVEQVKKINARHVIWCTVPHVTIAPIAHGIPSKVQPGSRYFTYYVRPWITDLEHFDPDRDEHLTANEARLVDSAIDIYNDAITDVVREARSDASEPRDWRIFELYGLLEGLAARRYSEGHRERPVWLPAYPLPPAVTALGHPEGSTDLGGLGAPVGTGEDGPCVPDTRFLDADAHGARIHGGLFALDGVHPTTVGYGVIAQELIKVMSGAGVVFRDADGNPRPDPVTVDWDFVIANDSLITRPPINIGSVMTWARRVDHAVDRLEVLFKIKQRVSSISQVVAPAATQHP